jgi:hypothetical protein
MSGDWRGTLWTLLVTSCILIIRCTESFYHLYIVHMKLVLPINSHIRSLKIVTLQLCGCTMFVYHPGIFKSHCSDIRIFLGCMWEAVLLWTSHYRSRLDPKTFHLWWAEWYWDRVFSKFFGFSLSSFAPTLHTHIHLPPAYTGCFIMYSGITKIYDRKTIGHMFKKPVQIEWTTQKQFSQKVVFHRSSHFCH